MFLVEPPPSQGDLHFRALGIPIRIHPLFWLMTVVLGLKLPPQELLIWIIAVVVSIVIHELGHAMLQRHFGGRPHIVLYGMGGLAICEDCDRSTRAQILISLAGPVAGFLFAILLVMLLLVTGHGIGILLGDSTRLTLGQVINPSGIPVLGTIIYWQELTNSFADTVVFNLLQINILWGLVNLLPIYPLDGGRISREVCQIGNPRGGIILSLQISFAAAVIMAAVGLLIWESILTTLMFSYLAYSSYQTLVAYRQNLW
jgi:stage IV sporulation protein FB